MSTAVQGGHAVAITNVSPKYSNFIEIACTTGGPIPLCLSTLFAVKKHS